MEVLKYLADAVTILVLVVFAIVGMKRGFVRSLLHSASFFIAIIACFCFANPITDLIVTSDMGISVKEYIYNLILTPVKEAPQMLLGDLSLPEFLIKGISESQPVIDIAESLSLNISNTIISVVVFILLFILTKFALKILDKTLGHITSLPLIKQLNSFLGGIMGIISGVLWIYVILTILAAFSFVPQIEPLIEIITESEILFFLYENNIILGLFS